MQNISDKNPSQSEPYDLLVIGGGINGAGIARDAAGRGAKVLLCEKDDLASHTSSASTKLIHGGLRYLEHYEFRLVRESLIERERLLTIAPHIIHPMRFILPHDRGLRPAWLLRLGLFLYDHIGGRKILPATKTINLREAPHRAILEDRLVKGFEYSDCWVDDARLVALNAVDAARHGANIRTRTECTGLKREGSLWSATLRHAGGTDETISARAIVNAAGPWVDEVLNRANGSDNPDPSSAPPHQNLRLVKGSHLIFPKLYDGDHCYIFQNRDGRIVFAIPYEGKFTLVGTTDAAFEGDPNHVEISQQESAYICSAVNEYLRADIAPEQAVWSYSGVRPLYDDKSANNSTVTRDYVFEMDHPDGTAPILSIFGGKITTYRKLAEHALSKLSHIGIVSGDSWTEGATLPGGDLNGITIEAYAANLAWIYDHIPQPTVQRLARAYGSEMKEILGTSGNLGEEIAPGLWEAELNYLVKREFARSSEDVLWRRSKLGLHFNEAERQAVSDWFARQ